MNFLRRASVIALLAGPLALAACAEPDPLYVDQAYIRLNPNEGRPAAGYLTIHGDDAADTKLLRVTSEAARRIEMHESVEKNGMMTMQEIDAVDIPAGQEVKFAPGGKHLMVFDINPAVRDSGKLTMTMLFSNGDRLIVGAAIQKTGAKDNAGDHDADGHGGNAHSGH